MNVKTAILPNKGSLNIVDKPSLEKVIQEIKKAALLNNSLSQPNHQKTASEYLNVIDAFDMPKLRYKFLEKSFSAVSGNKNLLAPAAAKADVFRNRFAIIYQRIMRNDAFSNEFGSNAETRQIIPIKNLVGREPGQFLLFGMLTLMKEGIYFLEDLDSCIELEFPQSMEQGPGMFTCNCFVLIHGDLTEEKKFRVNVIGMPPPESRTKSLAAYGNDVDFFGAPRSISDMQSIIEIEGQMSDSFFVILSDVWLDQTRVVIKLQELFEGFSKSTIPLAFILIGNFCSNPYIYDSVNCEKYKECFDQLMELLMKFEELADCHFIFVPGPNDPWCENILPRPKIPNYFTMGMQSRFKNAIFTSNPARIKYCSKEIVIFRDDLQTSLSRNCIFPPLDDDSQLIEEQVVSTLLDQSHLMPIPFQTRPIFWSYDHALSLYPQPHLLILADKCGSFSLEYEGTRVINPGSLPNTNFNFMVYQPSSGECQASEIRGEDDVI